MATRKKTAAQPEAGSIIRPFNRQTARFTVYGTSPYVQHAFSQKARMTMLAAEQVSKAASRKSKAPRDIEADYENAKHKTADGRYGIPAAAFRNAMISACRVAGFQMTRAKLSVSVIADAYDQHGTTPLVYLAGEPIMHESHVRLESGVASIAIRPMWPTWSADVTVQWDGDQFSQEDVANLLERAGQQVGIGEGRNDSKKSTGMVWGSFTLFNPEGE